MKQKGLVLKLKGTTAVIMTCDGRFLRVKVKGRCPAVGEQYCGEVLEGSKMYMRYLAVAAAVVLLVFSFSAFKFYYTAYASVVVDINPSIELLINRWERIIKAIPLNDDGGKILSRLQLTNHSIDDGLKMIVDESIKQNFIKADQSAMDQKSVSIDISYVKSGKELDLKSFEDYLTRASIKYNIRKQSAEEDNGVKDSKGMKDRKNEKESGNNKGQTDNKSGKVNDKDGKGNRKAKGNGENAIDRPSLNDEKDSDKTISDEYKYQDGDDANKVNNDNKEDSNSIDKTKKENRRVQNSNKEKDDTDSYKGLNYSREKNISIKGENKR